MASSGGISTREPALWLVLHRVERANAAGVRPSKALVAAGEHAQTRSRRYTQVDTLLERGLVRDVSERAGVYALELTQSGRALADGHADAAEVDPSWRRALAAFCAERA